MSQEGDSMEKLKGLQITSLDDDDEEEEEVEDYDMNEEEDDDDEEEEFVTLGFVEKPKNSWSLLRQLFPSKAGSVPAWLDPVNLPSGKACVCDICGEPLQFVLQVTCFESQLARQTLQEAISTHICSRNLKLLQHRNQLQCSGKRPMLYIPSN